MDKVTLAPNPFY